jgi:hypothetical protein
MSEMHAGLHVYSLLNMSHLNGFTIFHTILQHMMSWKSVQQFFSPIHINFRHTVQGIFKNNSCYEQTLLLLFLNMSVTWEMTEWKRFFHCFDITFISFKFDITIYALNAVNFLLQGPFHASESLVSATFSLPPLHWIDSVEYSQSCPSWTQTEIRIYYGE